MKKAILTKKIDAFTLTELLVVLVIVGILLLLALPNLMPLITRAHSTEARTQLGHAQTLQKTYFYEYAKYSDDLESIGFEQAELKPTGNANYRISILEVSNSGFIIEAESVVDFDQDGTFNKWQIDQDRKLEEVVRD